MKLLVTFSRKKGRKPIIAQVVRDTGVLINVERAIIDSSEGEALIDVPDEQCKLVSDTIIAPDATTADALSTAVNVLGPEKGLALIERLPDVEAILIPTDKTAELIFTTGAKAYVE